MDEELCNELLDDMDFHYNKVKCRKIEQMLPKLMKRVEVFQKLLELMEQYKRKNQWV